MVLAKVVVVLEGILPGPVLAQAHCLVDIVILVEVVSCELICRGVLPAGSGVHAVAKLRLEGPVLCGRNGQERVCLNAVVASLILCMGVGLQGVGDVLLLVPSVADLVFIGIEGTVRVVCGEERVVLHQAAELGAVVMVEVLAYYQVLAKGDYVAAGAALPQ